ncbi:ubiquinol-cytochrome c reductase iron-sulfur subunit [Rubrobacter indicoceani]|uniref:QcrA and Rieske domain-containing protein n=1 Tax=Rubrobacter indicoceani TaxID=2051957 RepID=UPI0013C40485|nr:Rieske (2Fe-2S) protein [Rubrobacter indicoceani]
MQEKPRQALTGSTTGSTGEPNPAGSGFTRGRFLGLGLALGAGASLVACSSETSGGSPGDSSGGSSATSEPSAPSTAQDGEAASSGSSQTIVATSEVPVGESFEFEADGEPAVLVHRSENEFVAYSAVCTHQRCEVAYRNRELVCPCHGSVFDVSSGEPTTGPANSPLPTIGVEVQGDEVVRA